MDKNLRQPENPSQRLYETKFALWDATAGGYFWQQNTPRAKVTCGVERTAQQQLCASSQLFVPHAHAAWQAAARSDDDDDPLLLHAHLAVAAAVHRREQRADLNFISSTQIPSSALAPSSMASRFCSRSGRNERSSRTRQVIERFLASRLRLMPLPHTLCSRVCMCSMLS